MVMTGSLKKAPARALKKAAGNASAPGLSGLWGSTIKFEEARWWDLRGIRRGKVSSMVSGYLSMRNCSRLHRSAG